MTATTKIVREQSFSPFESDIPQGLTLAQYRARRARRPGRWRRHARRRR
jgi:hypothetical protein